jgi:hypothetical protein
MRNVIVNQSQSENIAIAGFRGEVYIRDSPPIMEFIFQV